MTHSFTPISRRRLGLLAAALPMAAGLLRPALAQPSRGTSRVVGANLYEIVANPRTNTVYVAAAGQFRGNDSTGPKPQIVALDGTSLETKATIELEIPGFGLGISERSQTLFVGHTTQGSMTLIDLATGRVKGNARTGEGRPHLRQIAVDEQANIAYVTVFGARENPSSIWAVDGNAGSVARVLTEGLAEGGISGLDIDAPRKRLWATAMTSNEVVEIDIEQGKAIRRFPAGGEGAVNIAVDAEGRRLFVACQRSGDLIVLNAETGAVIRTVKTGEGALGVTYDPRRNRVYVANRRAGTVSVVDSRSFDVLANVETGTHPNTVAVNAETGLAYVSNKRRGPAQRGEAPPEDPNGDTVTIIRP